VVFLDAVKSIAKEPMVILQIATVFHLFYKWKNGRWRFLWLSRIVLLGGYFISVSGIPEAGNCS